MTQKRRLLRLGSSLSLFFLVACASVRPDPPDVSLKSLELVGFNLSHAQLKAELELYNPNSISLAILHADYRLKLNNVDVSHGQSTARTELPAHGRGILPLNLTAAYIDLIRFLNKTAKETPLSYQLDGTIEIGGLGLFSYPYPVHKQGTIDLQDWEP